MIEARSDLDRVLVIDEAKRELTLSDERIEKAITQNGARLIILDPIQAYMGEKTDMNRANEVRPMFRPALPMLPSVPGALLSLSDT